MNHEIAYIRQAYKKHTHIVLNMTVPEFFGLRISEITVFV